MFDVTDVISTLQGVAADLEGRNEELRQLDSVIGDGDLGVTVELGSKAIREFLTSMDEDDIGQLLAKCGLQFNKASPSTFGTLLASALIGAGKTSLGKKQIGIEDLALMGDGAIDGIKKRGRAEVGDKTMLDCLVPAVESFKRELAAAAEPEIALKAAVTAAETGMKATIDMMAKHGRARWHRENSVGVQDAGATALYYIIESFVRNFLSISGNKPE